MPNPNYLAPCTRPRMNLASFPGKILGSTEIRVSTEFDTLEAASVTAGIQEAIFDLPSTGGVVYVPAGTHVISQTINLLKNNITLMGAGPSTILSANTTNRLLHCVATTFSKITVRNLVIEGNNLCLEGFGATGTVTDFLFENLEVRNCTTSGFFFSNSLGTTVRGCYIHNCTQRGMDVDNCTSLYIVDCIIEYNGTDGVKVGGGQGLHLRDCTIRYNTKAGVWMVNWGVSVSGCNISYNTEEGIRSSPTGFGQRIVGNFIELNGKEGIRLTSPGGSIVANNMICDNGTSAGGTYSAIKLNTGIGNGKGVIISGNVLGNINGTDTLHAISLASGLEDPVIVNNIFSRLSEEDIVEDLGALRAHFAHNSHSQIWS